MLLCSIRSFGPLDSLRRKLECPCNNQRDRKTKGRDKDNKPNRPVRNVEEWKNLRSDLNQKPADDGIRDSNFVNIAPLQLGKEIALVHPSLGVRVFRREGGDDFFEPRIAMKRVPKRQQL